ncbi:MAG: tRNA pseudouridine(54/55) synthase Pus10 [Candidatus Lokiarchaeota archaeon]|nr:tRNA pseudouridine(54/55) synthase Pus10 [Candidatus Lokiarchaeota archaeon]
MTIFAKVLDIYREYYICPHCLGRMFSLLGTDTTNYDRGKSLLLTITMENHRTYLSRHKNHEEAIAILKILAERARFSPAQSVLDREGIEYNKLIPSEKCYLCNDIFSNVPTYAKSALESLFNLEFKNILVGTALDSQIVNREDNFKAVFNLLNSESFKNHFNREVGKEISNSLEKPSEFANPDITVIYTLGFMSSEVNLIIRSIFIKGRYNKFIRGIPQTHWDCRACRGKGCESCNFTGKQYKTSVEELINPEFIIEAKAEGSKFHGAGREDIDVKMLGKGRPFVLELNYPKVRTLNLEKIQKKVNKRNKNKVKISNLAYSTKEQVKNLKFNAENTKKVYKALTSSFENITKEKFETILNELKSAFENQKIQQRTPNRVSHRRADKIREKKIYQIEGKYIKPKIFEFIIEAQGGTYIKEIIHGDNGRTTPSFTDIFGFPIECKKLDVLKIY